jgi:hypothetical protein
MGNRRPAEERSPSPVAPARVIRNSKAWFAEGNARKAAARRMGRCVECLAPLTSMRALYCSPTCRWRFHGRFFWDSARVVVMRRDHYTCQRCHARRRRRELEVDHIVEIARGGPALDYANLQTLCRDCHRAKTSNFLRGRRRSPAGPSPSPSTGPGSSGVGEEPEWFPA